MNISIQICINKLLLPNCEFGLVNLGTVPHDHEQL